MPCTTAKQLIDALKRLPPHTKVAIYNEDTQEYTDIDYSEIELDDDADGQPIAKIGGTIVHEPFED